MTSQLVAPPTASVTSQMVRVTSASVAAMLLAAAVVHLVRHWQIEVAQPALSIGWLVSLLILGLLAILRGAWRTTGASTQQPGTRALWIVSSLAALAWSSSLALLASNLFDVSAIWLMVLASEAVWWALLLRPAANERRLTESSVNRASNDPRALIAALTEPDRANPHAALDEGVVQQLTRSETEEHGELIHGLLRCRFSSGERSQVQHVAFCPPLEAQPSILVDQIAGPAAKVKVAQAESFGVRFEIRLDRICRRPSDLVFEFFASSGDEGERRTAA